MDANDIRFKATTKKGEEITGWVLQSKGKWFIFDERDSKFKSIAGPETIRLIKVKEEKT